MYVVILVCNEFVKKNNNYETFKNNQNDNFQSKGRTNKYFGAIAQSPLSSTLTPTPSLILFYK